MCQCTHLALLLHKLLLCGICSLVSIAGAGALALGRDMLVTPLVDGNLLLMYVCTCVCMYVYVRVFICMNPGFLVYNESEANS